jgi:hypothetical protein
MGTLKMLIGISVLVAGVYLSFELLPPYFENYQFQDAMKQEATQDSYIPKSEDDIRASVLKKAQEYNIPITAEAIKVQREGSQFNGTVAIQAPYVVHIDLPGYPLDLHFNPSTQNRGVF